MHRHFLSRPLSCLVLAAPFVASAGAADLAPGRYLCAASVSDLDGSYLDTREVTIERDQDTISATTDHGIPLQGRQVGDRLYLMGSDIGDGGMQVIQVVAKIDGDTTEGDIVRSLDGKVLSRGQFVMRRAEAKQQ